MKFKRIIFLDIDGVLNSSDSIAEAWTTYVEDKENFPNPFYFNLVPECVKQLNRIIEETEAYVVISSTWRLGKKLAELRGILIKQGFKGKIVGKTKEIGGVERGKEIADWIKFFNPESFVILDDNSDMDNLMSYLVQTDKHLGLTKENANKAIKMLKGDKNEEVS